MSTSKTRPWKILIVIQRGKKPAADAENRLHQMGYPNVKVVGVENDQASENHMIELLKNEKWDGVSISGGLNKYDDFAREASTLHWTNRISYLIRQYAPQAKFIFLDSPDDLANGFDFDSVFGSAE